MATNIEINIQTKSLGIDGKMVTLDDAFQSVKVSVDPPLSLSLEYSPTKNKKDSPVYEDLDRLKEIHGTELLTRINANGSFRSNAHYLTLSGDIQATIYNEGLKREIEPRD